MIKTFVTLFLLVTASVAHAEPNWIGNPTASHSLAGVGIANSRKTGSLGSARAQAIVQARDELASLLEVHIDSLMETGLNASGDGTVDQAYKEFSSHVVYTSLKLSRPVDLWVDDEDNVFVLVALDERVARRKISSALEHDLKSRNEDMWRDFMTTRVKEKLNDEMDNLFSSSNCD